MTEAEVQAIYERCESATPGPWRVKVTEIHMAPLIVSGEPDDTDQTVICTLNPPLGNRRFAEDASFIAHARSDVPALVAEVDRQRRQVAWLQEQAGKFPDRLEAEREAAERAEGERIAGLLEGAVVRTEEERNALRLAAVAIRRGLTRP